MGGNNHRSTAFPVPKAPAREWSNAAVAPLRQFHDQRRVESGSLMARSEQRPDLAISVLPRTSLFEIVATATPGINQVAGVGVVQIVKAEVGLQIASRLAGAPFVRAKRYLNKSPP